MIPEDKRNVVKRALEEAFGVSELEDIRMITIGLSSALIFRIVVKGKAYLLRIITRTDDVSDPTHYFGSMKMGADAGLAPRIWYLNNEERISITDFIEPHPFPIDVARAQLPVTLKQLHALPPFARRVNWLEFVDNCVKKIKDGQILPAPFTAELFERYAAVASVYPRDSADWVSCHNDLKPENIIYDGKRPWLVDWEAAFLNDRYMDLSIIANFVVRNDEEEDAYLHNYFGTTASENQRARFFLMQQILHMSYFSFMLLIVSRAQHPIDPEMPRRGFREYHDRMWAGEIDLAKNEARMEYAWVHMDRLLQNLRSKRLEESLRVLRASRKGAKP